jgi:DNA-binding SARP family transcriptional activator
LRPGRADAAGAPDVVPGPVVCQVLGQVRLWAGNAELTGRWVKPRIVLAVLAVNLNQLVTVDQLIDAVWEDRPPRTARNSLQWLISTVRRGLLDAAGRYGLALQTTATGYRLTAAADLVDLFRFRSLMATARARPDERAAAELARQALALWQDSALADVGGSWAGRTRQELHRERISALATLFDLELRLGRHDRVVDQIWRAVDREPMSEVLAVQLMTALCRCGRDAEALGWYARLRERTIQALGAEPGHRLRALHVQILHSQLPAERHSRLRWRSELSTARPEVAVSKR